MTDAAPPRLTGDQFVALLGHLRDRLATLPAAERQAMIHRVCDGMREIDADLARSIYEFLNEQVTP